MQEPRLRGAAGAPNPSVEPPGTTNHQENLAPARAAALPTGAPTAAVWNAYSEAYRKRYGVEPVRNGKVNGQLAQLVKRIPEAEAPDVAAYYIGNNSRLYVNAGHPVDLLLRDAEKLCTEARTGRRVTETGARELDQRSESAGVWNRMLRKAEAADGHA